VSPDLKVKRVSLAPKATRVNEARRVIQDLRGPPDRPVHLLLAAQRPHPNRHLGHKDSPSRALWFSCSPRVGRTGRVGDHQLQRGSAPLGPDGPFPPDTKVEATPHAPILATPGGSKWDPFAAYLPSCRAMTSTSLGEPLTCRSLGLDWRKQGRANRIG
jgi:hypothetical protein